MWIFLNADGASAGARVDNKVFLCNACAMLLGGHRITKWCDWGGNESRHNCIALNYTQLVRNFDRMALNPRSAHPMRRLGLVPLDVTYDSIKLSPASPA